MADGAAEMPPAPSAFSAKDLVATHAGALGALLSSIDSEFPKTRRALVNKLCSGVAAINRVLTARPAARVDVVAEVELLLGGGGVLLPAWAAALP